ncbi:MAG: nucleotide exchange factor GrpE [Methanobrevibacter sp.]|jgi:molecular chaperone GrpE|nr:nucleotide exchange factor GrpE [Candidatus Methanovirga meridionalis]
MANVTKKDEKLENDLDQSNLDDKNEDLSEAGKDLAEAGKESDLKDKDSADVDDENLDKKDEELENELDQLKSDLIDKNEENLRLRAEFENFEKRNERHNQDIINFANEELIMNILDSYEDLERALNQSKNMDELKNGVALIYSKLKNVLEKEGLKEIKAKGVKFDPFKHEALMVEDKNDCEDGIIVEELMKGYTLKDKVIKYSKVKVCKKNKKE